MPITEEMNQGCLQHLYFEKCTSGSESLTVESKYSEELVDGKHAVRKCARNGWARNSCWIWLRCGEIKEYTFINMDP